MKLIKNNDLFLLEEIVKKNFASKYKDSVLGILWTILNPLLMMALFTIVFSTIFSRNIENYPVYYLCGWCIVTFFNGVISMSMNSLRGNKNILQRTPAPKYIFVLGTVLSESLTFIIMLILLVVVMVVTHAQFYWLTIPFSIIPLIALFFMVTGFALMFSIICVYYTDVQHLWSVIGMAIFYISGVFFPMEIIPQPYRQYFMLNPIYWAINQLRCFVYHGIFPQITYILNFLILSLIILVLGIIIFKKYENKITMKF